MKKVLKTIEIAETTILHNEGTTDEKYITSFVVTVNDLENGDATQEPFATREQANTYASDIATRPFRPFVFGNSLLTER